MNNILIIFSILIVFIILIISTILIDSRDNMDLTNIIKILSRQSARWSVASIQDENLIIKLLHANYGGAYYLLLSNMILYNDTNIDIDINRLKKEVKFIEFTAINNINKLSENKKIDLNLNYNYDYEKYITKNSIICNTINESIKLYKLSIKALNSTNLLEAVIYINYSAGLIWALRDIFTDLDIIKAYIDIIKLKDMIINQQDITTVKYMNKYKSISPKSSYLTSIAKD
jgi:hypothetical protein